MWWWNGDNMAMCRELLSESEKGIRTLTQEFLQGADRRDLSQEDSRFFANLSELLMQTARFEILLSEGLEKIDKIYRKNEEDIADLFDLEKAVPPRIELGISRFDGLKGHEKQMPFIMT